MNCRSVHWTDFKINKLNNSVKILLSWCKAPHHVTSARAHLNHLPNRSHCFDNPSHLKMRHEKVGETSGLIATGFHCLSRTNERVLCVEAGNPAREARRNNRNLISLPWLEIFLNDTKKKIGNWWLYSVAWEWKSSGQAIIFPLIPLIAMSRQWGYSISMQIESKQHWRVERH